VHHGTSLRELALLPHCPLGTGATLGMLVLRWSLGVFGCDRIHFMGQWSGVLVRNPVSRVSSASMPGSLAMRTLRCHCFERLRLVSELPIASRGFFLADLVRIQ
jgi:hypothetical protein